MLDATDLPDDIAALKAMLIAAQAREVRKDERMRTASSGSANSIASKPSCAASPLKPVWLEGKNDQHH